MPGDSGRGNAGPADTEAGTGTAQSKSSARQTRQEAGSVEPPPEAGNGEGLDQEAAPQYNIVVRPRHALAAGLALVVAVRLLSLPSVVRGGDIVLLGNDPYAYFDVVSGVVGGSVPVTAQGGFGMGEPLFVAAMALASGLAGGHTGVVLAVYPLVAGLGVAAGAYLLAALLTEDVRVALAAVVLVAVTPLNVSRTAAGFADHHAFDLFVVTLVGTALTWLIVRRNVSPRARWAVGGVLGIGIGAQSLAWNASPVLLVPAGLGLVGYSILAVRAREPIGAFGPILFGLALGGAIAQLLHHWLGWQSALVAITPVLLFAGVATLAGLVWLVRELERSWVAFLAGGILAAVLGTYALTVLAPSIVADATTETAAAVDFFGRHATTGIGETDPITSAFGPLLGFVVLLGFAPILGVPAVAIVAWRAWRTADPKWAVPAVYLAWFLGLSFIQRRFAVHLTPFLGVFAGIGFVALVDWLGLFRVPARWLRERTPDPVETLRPPERERLALLGTMGAVGLAPSLLLSREIQSRLEIDDVAYRAAAWIRADATARDLAYPANYVLAEWGRVRMYNHLVNGRSRSYSYARQHYESFLTSHDADAWYEEFDGRVGYVVTRDIGDVSPVLTQGLLHDEYGSGREHVTGVAHYRARWASADGDLVVFEVVPGATVTGTGPADTELGFETTVDLAPDETAIEFRRFVHTDGSGQFSVTLPHPGEYRVGGSTVTVPEAAVRNGGEIEVQLADS